MKTYTKTLPALRAFGFAPNVTLSIANGVVTLYGTVEDSSDRSMLEKAAGRLFGIKEVRNQVHVAF